MEDQIFAQQMWYLAMVVAAMIIISTSMTAHKHAREYFALLDFFDRIERKGVNPKAFIRPPARIYADSEDRRVMAAGVGIAIYTIVLLAVLAPFLSTTIAGLVYDAEANILLPAIGIGVVSMINYYGTTWVDSITEELREDRRQLINRFVFSVDVAEHFDLDSRYL